MDAARQSNARLMNDSSVWPRSRSWLAATALVVLVALAYLPAVRGGFVLDDDDYVTANPHLRSVDGLRAIWFNIGELPDYYALTNTSFWAEYQLWGNRPFGYHFVNIVLHVLNVLLLWRLLCVLRFPGAWLCAAVFAVHPVGVESVAWIAERKNTLSMFFALASMLCYFKFEPAVEPSVGTDQRQHSWWFYGAALGLFVASLLSKTATVALPVVILICYWWKHGRIDRGSVVRLAPFFGVALAMGLLTVWVESHFNGARGENWSFSPTERVLIAGRAHCFYASKLFWPEPLVFVYPRWTIDAACWWQYLFPGVVAAVVAALWFNRRRFGRGAVSAVGIFAVVLFPVLGLFNISYMKYSFVADHFQYHAMAAIVCGAISAGFVVCNRWQWPYAKRAAALCSAALLIGLMALSWRQSQLYRDSITLYQATLEENPNCWLIRYNLGNALAAANRRAEAIRCFSETLELNPSCAEAHNNLGMQLLLGGELNQAIGHFQTAVRIRSDLVDAHRNLGVAMIDANRPQEAIDCFRRVLVLQPANAAVHNNLAGLLLRTDRVAEAMDHCQQAIRLEPAYLQPHMTLALANARLNNTEAALAAGERALEIAKSTGEIKARRQIERWLAQYRVALNAGAMQR